MKPNLSLAPKDGLLAVRATDIPDMVSRYSRAAADPAEAKVHQALVGTPSPVGSIALLQLLDYIDQRYWCSTERVAQILNQLAANPDVAAIVLEIDSPGGSVYGVSELAKVIRDVREKKKVVAIANSLMASAAYWIGAQASELWVAPGGEVGSIGIWQLHMDYSRMMDAAGVTPTLIAAGEYKVESNPWEPLSDDAKAFLQKRVDEYFAIFQKDVADGRGAKLSAVKEGFGQGRVLGAKEALAEGMVDKIGTLPELMAKLGGRRGAATRALLERHQALVERTSP